MDSFRETFSLSIKFRNLLDNFEWWLTGVYGPCVANLKCNFLDELRHLQTIVDLNWVLGSDFNIIRFTHEHMNRAHVSLIMTNFNNSIASANLIEFFPNNCIYTWSNFQENVTMVKLD